MDDEIVDIFVEEATEVLENIDRQLPRWKEEQDNQKVLTELRRAYHTLKGSGRMVKALDIGELAWKIENMLNRVLDGSIGVSQAVVDLVEKARGALPAMLESFRTGQAFANSAEVELMMAHADALARGEALPTAPAAPAIAAGAGERDMQAILVRLERLERSLDKAAQRADESLHRAEMALQNVRKLSVELKEQESDPTRWATQTDIGLLSDRVKAVFKDIQDVRQVARASQEQATTQIKTLKHNIERRVNDKIAVLNNVRAEMQQELDEHKKAIASTRQFALLAAIASALIFSLLVGASVLMLK